MVATSMLTYLEMMIVSLEYFEATLTFTYHIRVTSRLLLQSQYNTFVKLLVLVATTLTCISLTITNP